MGQFNRLLSGPQTASLMIGGHFLLEDESNVLLDTSGGYDCQNHLLAKVHRDATEGQNNQSVYSHSGYKCFWSYRSIPSKMMAMRT